MIQKLIKKIWGDPYEKRVKPYYAVVEKINGLEQTIAALSDDALKAKTSEFKERLKGKDTLDTILPEAFAVVRETAKRVLNMRHFDVQLIGGMVLHEGRISEMKTGEGKTLVATLPAYLNALEENGVYIVTVNDYLAKRDSEWMGQIYSFLGLSVGLIQSGMEPQERLEAYKADITFGTNNEFGFDYLRDNLAYSEEEISQNRRHYAIIDEVDSILIDEARTPLIISGPVKDSTAKYKKVVPVAKKLKKGTHFTVDEKHKNVVLTDDGNHEIEKLMNIDNIYSLENMDVAHIVLQSLKALYLFKKDVDYVVKEGQVVIVDEFTGRLMDGRRYSDGLHQAIEAVENLKIQDESQTLASVTFQNYFRMFPKLAGMTGTAVTEEAEFGNIYGLEVVVIPTNKPIAREDKADVVYKSKQEKYRAIVNEIKKAHQDGTPMLVGTISIETSELLSKMLLKEQIPHKVLNAKFHEQEAEIIADAGQKGNVTIATNMAGRGTDIKLGDAVKENSGLYVIGSERHESRRIDNQLRGRSGRQGDPGQTKFFVSLEDELMRLFGSDRIISMMDKLGLPDDTPIEHGMVSKSIERAQTKVEKYHFGIRKQVLQFDDVVNKQRETIYRNRNSICLKKDLDNCILDFSTTYINSTIDMFSDGKALIQEDRQDLLKRLEAVFPITNISDVLNQLQSLTELKQRLIKAASDMYQDRKHHFNAEIFEELVVKRVLLMTLDRKWIDHLNDMDSLREGIGLRSYGQKDPLIEYKREAFDMFKDLMVNIAEEALSIIFRAEIVNQQQEEKPEEIEKPFQLDTKNKQKSVTKEQEIGRNDKVTIQKEGKTQILKWKKAESMLAEGWELVGAAK